HGRLRRQARRERRGPADRHGRARTLSKKSKSGRRVRPVSRTQDLIRPEGGLISHFTAFLYPISQVEPWQAGLTALFDLPQYGPGPQAAGCLRFEEGINGG